MDVVSVGNLNLDVVYKVSKLLDQIKVDEKVPCWGLATYEGGTAYNLSFALKKLAPELSVGVVGCVGKDKEGERLIQKLAEIGADVSCIRRVDKPTGRVFIPVDEQGRKICYPVAGANEELGIGEKEERYLTKAKRVFLTNIYPLKPARTCIEVCKKEDIKIFWNPLVADQTKEEILELYPEVDFLVLNKVEVEELTDKKWKHAGEELSSSGEVVVTLGEEGCAIFRNHEYKGIFSAFPVGVKDSTGMGDAFNAAYCEGELRGLPLEARATQANAYAALAGTKTGATEGMCSREEFLQFLKNQERKDCYELLKILEGKSLLPVVSRDSIQSFQTLDGSLIRELYRDEFLSKAEATLKPGQKTKYHYHAKSKEQYYILEGRGRMQIEGLTREVAKDDLILIEPGQKHRIENLSKKRELRFLCLCYPPYSHEDYFEVKQE